MVAGEIIGLGKDIIEQLLHMDVLMVFIILFFLAIIGWKILSYLMKAAMVGIVFAAVPIALNFLGYPMPLSFTTIFSWAVAGLTIFFLYHSIATVIRGLKFIMRPFGSDKKEKTVVLKEKIIEKEKKDRK
jgi:hypothetical protein